MPWDAALARSRAEAREQQRRHEAREAAEREARRPVCTDCAHKFSDGRWTAVDVRDWGRSRESHPHLCEECQSRAVAAGKQAEADECERQEQERFRQEAEAEQAARKAGGWLGRWRT